MVSHRDPDRGDSPQLSSPEQGIFQSIGHGYETLTKLFDAVDHIEDRLSGKVVASVMDPSLGLTPVAAAASRSQRLFQLVENDSTTRQYMDFSLAAGMPPTLIQHTLNMVADFAYRHCELQRQELGTAFEKAITDAELHTKCAAIKAELDTANSLLQSIEESWRAVQGSESSGRAAFAVRRDTAVQQWVEETTKNTDLYRRMALLESSIKGLMDSSEQELIRVQGDVRMLDENAVKKTDDHSKMLNKQLKFLQEQIAPGGIPKSAAINGILLVPVQMNTLLRGQEFVQEMESFRILNSSFFHVTGPEIKRVGHDMDPVSGRFHRPPSSLDGYAGVDPATRERYQLESETLYTKITSSPNVTPEMIQQVLRPFNIGTRNTDVAVIGDRDGVSLYWAFLSLFRPLNATYRNDVENYLDKAYELFEVYDGHIVANMSVILKHIHEAKLMGVRIKWHKTGERWLTKLSERPNFAVGLQRFDKCTVDPDDCVLRLEEMCREISVIAVKEFTSEDTNAPFKQQTMAMAADAGEEDYDPFTDHALADWGVDDTFAFATHDMNGDMRPYYSYNRNPHKGKGKGSPFVPNAGVVPGKALSEAMARGGRVIGHAAKGQRSYGRSSGRGGRGPYRPPAHYAGGYQGMAADEHPAYEYTAAQMAAYQASGQPTWDRVKGCFGDACPRPKHHRYELCNTCHVNGSMAGKLKCRDGQYHAVVAKEASQESKVANARSITLAGQKYRSGAGAMLAEDTAGADEMDAIVGIMALSNPDAFSAGNIEDVGNKRIRFSEQQDHSPSGAGLFAPHGGPAPALGITAMQAHLAQLQQGQQ
ncbi:MAG: hypothetical protein ISR34_11360 [Pirellulales bacterium]|nr:hypothetical protein [Pirellulales bacterium]